MFTSHLRIARAREFAGALAAVRVRAIERSSAKGKVIWLQPEVSPAH